jgi:hypothetical protein
MNWLIRSRAREETGQIPQDGVLQESGPDAGRLLTINGVDGMRVGPGGMR